MEYNERPKYMTLAFCPLEYNKRQSEEILKSLVIEWEIDLGERRLISLEDPKLVRKLSKEEVKQINNLIKEKNGRKNKM